MEPLDSVFVEKEHFEDEKDVEEFHIRTAEINLQ